MKIEIEIFQSEAELLLFSLALRARQTKLNSNEQSAAIALGKRLDAVFTKVFDWQPMDRMKSYTRPIKRVTITCYDYPPPEGKV